MTRKAHRSNLLEHYKQHRDEIDILTDKFSLLILAFVHQLGKVSSEELAHDLGLSLPGLRERLIPFLRCNMLIERENRLFVSTLGRQILVEIGFIELPTLREPRFIDPIIAKDFVGREEQIENFRSMLKPGSPKQMMTICGRGQVGKTWLVRRLMFECSAKHPWAYIDFRRPGFTYLEILRSIRDQLDRSPFADFTRMLDRYTTLRETPFEVSLETAIWAVPGIYESGMPSVGISEESTMLEAILPKTSARASADKPYLQVFQISARSKVRGVVESEMLSRLTREFTVCLNQFSAGQKVVLFFDTLEQAPEEVREWLGAGMLPAIYAGHLPNVVVVLAGREKLALGVEWEHLHCEHDLGTLDELHILEYCRKQGFDYHPLAQLLFSDTGGYPAEVATRLKALELQAKGV